MQSDQVMDSTFGVDRFFSQLRVRGHDFGGDDSGVPEAKMAVRSFSFPEQTLNRVPDLLPFGEAAFRGSLPGCLWTAVRQVTLVRPAQMAMPAAVADRSEAEDLMALPQCQPQGLWWLMPELELVRERF